MNPHGWKTYVIGGLIASVSIYGLVTGGLSAGEAEERLFRLFIGLGIISGRDAFAKLIKVGLGR
jgi:hypothetical protein